MKRILVLLTIACLFASAAAASDAKLVNEGRRGGEDAATDFLEIRSPLDGAVLQGSADDTVTLA